MFNSDEWEDGTASDLQDEDGTIGSGIFDPEGQSTVHSEMGVFADHPALPAYIANHPPFRPFEDERGIEMEVPSGGAAYIDIPNQPSVPFEPSVDRIEVEPSMRPSLVQPSQWSAPLSRVSTVEPGMQSMPLTTSTAWVQPMQLPAAPQIIRAPATAIRGFGEVSAPTWPQYAVAGVLLGVAIGLIHNTIQARKGE